MSYIIVCRNPTSRKLLIISNDDSNDPAEFETVEEAYEAANGMAVCRAWGVEIVLIDR
jgi:hypothetical protein